jgi:hypothetical protein
MCVAPRVVQRFRTVSGSGGWFLGRGGCGSAVFEDFDDGVGEVMVFGFGGVIDEGIPELAGMAEGSVARRACA